MSINSIQEIIEDIRAGIPVILMDDEDRENEGDLIVAAEAVTPEIVNFMTREARGLLCLALTGKRCDYLKLPQMVSSFTNRSRYNTAFTVSIEAAQGVTTGISAQDRATTILAAVNAKSKPSDIVQPGHIFPLRAQPGGVLNRAGHTEAGCDIARLAGFTPAAALIEIMNDDGSMARFTQLKSFAHKHKLKIGTVADLIKYRLVNEKTIEKVSESVLDTAFGCFNLSVYSDFIDGGVHLALSKGSLTAETPTLVRVHIAEPMKDLLAVQSDAVEGWSIQKVLAKIAEVGHGVVVLLQPNGIHNFYDSFKKHFLNDHEATKEATTKTYHAIGIGSQILKDLGIGKIKLLSTPIKFIALSGFGLEIVEYVVQD